MQQISRLAKRRARRRKKERKAAQRGRVGKATLKARGRTSRD